MQTKGERGIRTLYLMKEDLSKESKYYGRQRWAIYNEYILHNMPSTFVKLQMM